MKMEINGTQGAANFALRQALRQPASLLGLVALTPTNERSSLATPPPPSTQDWTTAVGKGTLFSRLA